MNRMEQVERSLLDAVLDRLLPPYEELQGAGAMGLGAEVVTAAAQSANLDEPAARVLAALPDGFMEAPLDVKDEVLIDVQAADPAAFAAMLNLAYNAYYTDPRVLRAIELRTGYAARPPQPEGYHLEPFDQSLLAQVRTRAPLWRDVR